MLHSYDPATKFCTSCGRSAGWIFTFGSECRDDILPITPKLAKRRGTWVIESLEALNWQRKK